MVQNKLTWDDFTFTKKRGRINIQLEEGGTFSYLEKRGVSSNSSRSEAFVISLNGSTEENVGNWKMVCVAFEKWLKNENSSKQV